MCIDAAAYDLPSGTSHISVDTIHSWLGDTIPAQYVGTDGQYHATTATWRNSETILGTDMGYGANIYNGRAMGFYIITIPSADVGTWTPLAPIALVTANLHFSNVKYADFGFGYYINNKYRNVSYASCQPYCYLDYNYGGTYSKLYNPESDGSINSSYSGHLGIFTARYTAQYGSVYGGGFQRVEGSASDLYLGDVAACCLGYFDGNLWLGLGLTDIIINDDYVLETSAPPPQGGESGGGDTPSGPSSGTVTGTISDNGDGTQDVNITIEQDNSGLLSGLKDILASVFIPSQEYMNNWHQEIEDSFKDHLGGVAQAVSLIDEQADYLRAATSADYVYFPELTLPIGDSGGSASRPLIGADYTLIEGRQVELRPARDGKLKVLWDFVEFAVDVVCVLAVFNMLQTKYEIFLNPDGEVIDYDN